MDAGPGGTQILVTCRPWWHMGLGGGEGLVVPNAGWAELRGQVLPNAGFQRLLQTMLSI